MNSSLQQPPRFHLARPHGTATLFLSGSWKGGGLPAPERVLALVSEASSLSFDASALTAWDTGLAVFIQTLKEGLEASKTDVKFEGLPKGLVRLLLLCEKNCPSKKSRQRAALFFLPFLKKEAKPSPTRQDLSPTCLPLQER